LIKIFLLIFSLQASLIFSQTNFDSLMQNISGKDDSVKIRMLNDLSWDYRSNNPPLALQLGNEAVKIARSHGDNHLLAESINLVGVVYRYLNKYDKALDNFKEALEISVTSKDTNQIAYSYNNIGGLYRVQGSYDLALEYIFKALYLFEKIKDNNGAAFCTINIGMIYRRQKNFQKALEYLMRTLQLREQTGDRNGKALALIQIAKINFETGNSLSALNYYYKVEKEYSYLDDQKGLADTWGGIADILSQKENNAKSIEYRIKALEMAEKIGYVQGIVTSRISLGFIYAQEGKINLAENYFNDALKLADSSNIASSKIECYSALSKFNELKKDFKQAYFYSQKTSVLRDSLRKKENIERTAGLEAIYDWEKREKENILLYKDLELKERQRNYLFVIVVLVLFVSFVMYRMYRSKKIDSEQLAKFNTMKDTLLRIIAHDLKTPFNVIFGYTEVLKEDFKSISDEEKLTYLESIRKASRLSIQLLENLTMWSKSHADKIEFKPANINLGDVVKENIYILEPSAESKKISITSTIPENVEVFADENMLKTILRNLISNGIKFTNEKGKINIYCEQSKNEVKIFVEDNGVGMDDVTKESLFNLEEFLSAEGTAGERGTGFGLVLCKEFVSKNGGKIWAESELGIGSKFIFTLRPAV